MASSVSFDFSGRSCSSRRHAGHRARHRGGLRAGRRQGGHLRPHRADVEPAAEEIAAAGPEAAPASRPTWRPRGDPVLFRNLEDESAHRRAGQQRRRAGLLPLPRHGAGDLALDGAGQPERAFLLSKLTANLAAGTQGHGQHRQHPHRPGLSPRRGPHRLRRDQGGLQGLTKSMALELAPSGIRENGVRRASWTCPASTPSSATPRRINATPAGRMVTVDEIADAVLYLASDSSARPPAPSSGRRGVEHRRHLGEVIVLQSAVGHSTGGGRARTP